MVQDKKIRRLELAVGKKVLDITGGATLTDGTPTIIPIGTTITDATNSRSSRDSRGIECISLTVNGRFRVSEQAVGTSEGGSSPTVRMVIFWDRKPIGDTIMTWTQMFVAAQTNSLMNIDEEFKGRFQIVHDCLITPSNYSFIETAQTTNTYTPGSYVHFKHFLKLKNKRMQWNADGVGTQTSIEKNQLILMYLMQGSPDRTLVIDCNLRLRWMG